MVVLIIFPMCTWYILEKILDTSWILDKLGQIMVFPYEYWINHGFPHNDPPIQQTPPWRTATVASLKTAANSSSGAVSWHPRWTLEIGSVDHPLRKEAAVPMALALSPCICIVEKHELHGIYIQSPSFKGCESEASEPIPGTVKKPWQIPMKMAIPWGWLDHPPRAGKMASLAMAERFHKWGYPKMVFVRGNPSINGWWRGWPHLWKPPYIIILSHYKPLLLITIDHYWQL